MKIEDVLLDLGNLGLEDTQIPSLREPSADQENLLRALFSGSRAWHEAIGGRRDTIDFSNIIIMNPEARSRGETADFSGFQFLDGIDFSGSVFLGRAIFDRTTFLGSASFNRAIFLKLTHFQSARFRGALSFNDALFLDSCIFYRASFCGMTQFSRCRIKGNTNFSECSFQQQAELYGATFQHEASFRSTTFKNPCSFTKSSFLNKADFSGCSFEDNVDFDHATFHGEACHQGSLYSRRASFANVEFKSFASFVQCTFSSNTMFTDANFYLEGRFHTACFEKVPSLAGTSWRCIPDFRDTILPRSPDPSHFDSLLSLLKSTDPVAKQLIAEKAASAKLRVLWSMCEHANDHYRKLQYFGLIMRADKRSLPISERIIFSLYEYCSNYGQSLVRPLFSFLLLILISVSMLDLLWPGGGCFYSLFRYALSCGVTELTCKSLKLSLLLVLVNVFPFLSSSDHIREAALPNTEQSFSFHIVLLSASLVSIILLFFLVLAIRNRFKLR